MLVMVAVLSGIALLVPTLQSMSSPGLSPTQAVLLINREKAHIVDVRSSEEFATGHLIGAKNIALDALETGLGKAFNDKNAPLFWFVPAAFARKKHKKSPPNSVLSKPTVFRAA
jgi:hypothetical protein